MNEPSTLPNLRETFYGNLENVCTMGYSDHDIIIVVHDLIPNGLYPKPLDKENKCDVPKNPPLRVT